MIWHLFTADAITPRLLLLAKMIDREASRQLAAEYAISLAQWRVLAFVCISGPATASFICESGEADPAEVSRAVKALTASGLVTRDFAPGSRKTMVIAPTKEGKACFRTIIASRKSYFSGIVDNIPPDTRAMVIDALGVIAQEVVRQRAENRGAAAIRAVPAPASGARRDRS